MRTIKNELSKLSVRSRNVLLYLLVMGVGAFIVTTWAKSLLFFFLLPFQMSMVVGIIGNQKQRKTAMFCVVTALLLWMFLVYALHDRWNADGMAVLLAMLMCWYGALFTPEGTDHADIRRELLGMGMIFIVCYLPFMLIALVSIFTGKLFKLPFDAKPIGIQTAGNVGDRIRILAHPNGVARVTVFNLLFSVYGMIVGKKKGLRVFLIFVMVINAMILAHTQSRTGYMALGLALGMLVFRGVYFLVKKKGLRLIAAGVALALVFLGTIYGLDGLLKADVAVAKHTAVVKAEDISVRSEDHDMFEARMSGRDAIWESAFDYLKEHPKCFLAGIGSQGTTHVLGEESELLSRFNVHSSYLDVLIHLGVPGVLLLLLFLILLVKPAWRTLLMPASEKAKGLYILPVLVVTTLVLGLTETGLFLSAGYLNYLLMAVSGLMLRCAQLQKNEKIG